MAQTAASRWGVGVDLGGTNVRVAAVDERGALLELLTEPVEWAEERPPGSFAQLVELIARLTASRACAPRAIGVGASGPVHRESGVIANPYTLPPQMQGPVVSVLASAFRVPVTLENDADASALGEAWRGAGEGGETVVALTVGTGIGVGVVHRGRVVRGARGAHGEAGHMVVDPSGPACYCGAHGCLESLASGTAIAARGREAGLIDEAGSAIDVHRLARDGDAVARRIVDAARVALAHGARNLAAAHAPDVLVLTGNGIGDPEAVCDAVAATLRAFTLAAPEGTAVRAAVLGDVAGCLGAAKAALEA